MHTRPLRQLEQDLELARLHGRWLADDELAQLAQQRLDRRRLVVLLIGCLLIPPLWPLACAVGLYLLFPTTIRRLVIGLGVSAVLVGLVGTLLVAALVISLL